MATDLRGVASLGCTFFLTKNLMTFLVITLSCIIIYVVYCHQLLFYLICGGALHQIQPHFCIIPTKMPRKIKFFRRLGGAPAPPASPAYVYGGPRVEDLGWWTYVSVYRICGWSAFDCKAVLFYGVQLYLCPCWP